MPGFSRHFKLNKNIKCHGWKVHIYNGYHIDFCIYLVRIASTTSGFYCPYTHKQAFFISSSADWISKYPSTSSSVFPFTANILLHLKFHAAKSRCKTLPGHVSFTTRITLRIETKYCFHAFSSSNSFLLSFGSRRSGPRWERVNEDSIHCIHSSATIPLYMLNHNILALAVPINQHMETTMKPVINNHTCNIQISWSNLEIYIYNHKLEFTTVKMVLYNSSVLLMLYTGN